MIKLQEGHDKTKKTHCEEYGNNPCHSPVDLFGPFYYCDFLCVFHNIYTAEEEEISLGKFCISLIFPGLLPLIELR